MVLGMRIGGLAAAAVSAWLTLQPGPLVVQSPPHVAQESVVQSQEAVEPSLVYRSPVDAEVIDPFRPPAHVGAPGNRGLEYDPEPGLPVRASAEGEVVFAGSVVHNRFVTVLHRDGLRTSYGYLGWIAVEEGDWVALGQQLGTTSERFFFSIRHGDRYLDPALVLTAGRVRLVPHLEPRGRSRLPAYGSVLWLGYRVPRPGSSSRPKKLPPGASHGRQLVLTPGFAEPLGEEKSHGASRDDAPTAGCRSPLRTPDSPLESQDAALHFR